MRKRNNKKKNKISKLTILFIFLDLFAILGFVMMYGPWDGVRNFYVNTAMKTKDHQYLAKIFYSDKVIDKIITIYIIAIFKWIYYYKF